MKKIKVLFTALFIIVMLIVPVSALEINSASNKFVFDNSVISKNNVSGDLIAFAGNVSIDGNINGDIISAAQTVSIQNSDTANNILTAGGTVSITSKKARNIYALGNLIKINKGTDINGAYLAGRDVYFSGKTKDLYISGAKVNIDGDVLGNLVIRSDDINISNASKIGGMVVIYASKEPQLPATINKANVKFNKIEKENDQKQNAITAMIIMKIFSLLSAILMAVIFTLINSKYFLLKAKEFKSKIGYSILYGLIAFIVIPIASFIAMILIISIPISMIVLMLYCLTLFVAPVYTGIVLGRLFLKSLNRYLAAIAGTAVVSILLMIPFIGALVFLFCAFYTLGSIVRNIKLGKKETDIEKGSIEKSEIIIIEKKDDTTTS